MIDWIFSNLQIVIAVVVVIYWLLKSRSSQGEGEAPGPNPGEGRGTDEVAEAERTRQIQEEIRRRILARQRGESAPPPVVVFEEPPEREEPEYTEEGPRPVPPPLPRIDPATTAILEQQHRLAQQLQALRDARARATAGISALPSLQGSARIPTGAQLSPGSGWRRELRRDLRQSTSVRRAILLKEILGEPVGLQRGQSQIPRR